MPTKAPARKKVVARKKAPAKKPKILGRIVHYYDHIGVAIVECASPLKLADMIIIKRKDDELPMIVSSLQIDHMAVHKAAKGDIVGMKVSRPVQEGALVLPA